MKTRTYLLTAVLALACFQTLPAVAIHNTFSAVLAEIEANNLTIAAASETLAAERLEASSTLNPENPEAGFNYLWGSPERIGHRVDFEVKQTFDFPSAYVYRKRLADNSSDAAACRYRMTRLDVLREAESLCIDICSMNARRRVYITWVENARTLYDLYKQKALNGEATDMEVRRTNWEWMDRINDLQDFERERDAMVARLVRMNGGRPLPVLDSMVYHMDKDTLSTFEDWYAVYGGSSPLVAYEQHNAAAAQNGVRLARTASLPRFSVGYMSEKETEEHFRGITTGISIPIFENKHQVRKAASAQRAAELRREDALQEYEAYCRYWFDATKLLSDEFFRRIDAYTQVLVPVYDMLSKALDAGEITLSDFLNQVSASNSDLLRCMEMECELAHHAANLYVYQL